MKNRTLLAMILGTIVRCSGAENEKYLEYRASIETQPYVVIDKSDSKLDYISQKEQFSFDVSFGLRDGDKKRVKDLKTPKGEYYVCEVHDSYRNGIFIGLSYPNIADAERGLTSGIITKEEYNAIKTANEKKVCPPRNTKLGGEVGIHGKVNYKINGKYYDVKNIFDLPFIPLINRSAGCIMGKNYNIEKLSKKVHRGTKVIIR